MTVEEIRASSKEMLTCADICKIVGCDQYSIVLAARADPKALGFPVCVMGTRVRIPRRGFLNWLEFGNRPIMMEEGNE